MAFVKCELLHNNRGSQLESTEMIKQCMNIDLLKRGFLVTASWQLHKMLIVLIVSSHANIRRDKTCGTQLSFATPD